MIPVRVARKIDTSISDQRLKSECLGRLAFGILPTEQWACVFSNPKLMTLPELRCKAFSVWLPTLIDYIGEGWPEIQQFRAEAISRGLDCGDIFELGAQLAHHTISVLSLLSRDEQL